MKLDRLKDITYVNYHDDYNYHMDKYQFKNWFKNLGNPKEFEFNYCNQGNDVWNFASKTLQKHTNYEFSIITGGKHRILVSKKHIRDDWSVEKELIKRYTLWANQVLKANEIRNNTLKQ